MKHSWKQKISSPLALPTAFAAGIIVFIAGVFLIQPLKQLKSDWTEDRKHTLSPNTLRVLEELERDINIQYYVSKSENILPTGLRGFSTRVEDFLRDLSEQSGGKVHLKVLDPQPDSPAEDSAIIDEIRGIPLSSEVSFYFGLSVNCGTQRLSIPFLDPARESELEYNVIRRIHAASLRKKLKVSLLPSKLPLSGTSGYSQWYLLDVLEKQFDIKLLLPGEWDPETDILMAIHPLPVEESVQEKIEDFLHAGGKIIASLDPGAFCLKMFDIVPTAENNQSSWPELIQMLGLDYRDEYVIIDFNMATEVNRGEGLQKLPFALDVSHASVNPNHVITENLSWLHLPGTGGFTFNPATARTFSMTPLIFTTPDAFLRHTSKVADLPNVIQSPDIQQGAPYIMAALFEGKISSEAAARRAGVPAQDSKIVLTLDADFFADPFIGSFDTIQEERQFFPRGDNFAFFQESIGYLSDQDILRDIRKRSIKARPLTYIIETQAKVEKEYRPRLRALIAKAQETSQRLQQERPGSSRAEGEALLSQQRAEKYEDLKQQHRAVRQELRALRHQKRIEVERVKSQIIWANTTIMPLLGILTGSIILWFRKKKTSVRS